MSRVARDNNSRTVAQPGEEHLHLGDGGVLSFVEDDEGLVQRPSAHKGEGDNFDDIPLDVPPDLLVVEHFGQGVEQWSQEGIDLGQHVAGQEPKLFPRLDRRADQHNLADLLLPEGVDRHRNREVSLAAPGRALAKDQVMIANRPDVIGLAGAAGQDPPGLFEQIDRLGGDQRIGGGCVGHRREVSPWRGGGQRGSCGSGCGRRATGHASAHHLSQHTPNFGFMQFAALLQHAAELLEDSEPQPNLFFGAMQAECVATDGDPHTEGFPYQLQVPVLSSEEERNVGRVGERQRIVHGIPGGRGRGQFQCLRLLAGRPLGCIITGLSGGVVGRAARIHGFWTARGGVRCGGRREQEWMAQAEVGDPHDQPSK